MKINVRILLITITIVILFSAGTTLLYYSITNTILNEQNTKAILNSTNNFIFTLQEKLNDIDEQFYNRLDKADDGLADFDIENTQIDFAFTLKSDSLIYPANIIQKPGLGWKPYTISVNEFIETHPELLIRYAKVENGTYIYYGILITEELLNEFSETVNAEIVFAADNNIINSYAETNDELSLKLRSSYSKLLNSENFEINSEDLSKSELLAVNYSPRNLFTGNNNRRFIIYNQFTEGYEFRAQMGVMIIIILAAGTVVSFILVILLTGGITKQIAHLSHSAEAISRGNLTSDVPIVTKDELGRLANTFNMMLSSLKHNERIKKNYTEFVTLINQNPTLKQVADAALRQIIESTNLTTGLMYIVYDAETIKLVSTYGIQKEKTISIEENHIYKEVIDTKRSKEYQFNSGFPQIKTGFAEIELKHLYVTPIIYNNRVIGILEVGTEKENAPNYKTYLSSILDQLAIGLSNAIAFESLEKVVEELRKVNNEYAEQNKQITDQNEELKVLHEQLTEKAEQLEEQKSKAVELSHVKSQFLASMSHELKTPLNSILGLTDLIINDKSTSLKTKDRLRVVLRNSKKLLNIISNILEFSKIESGKMEIDKSEFALNNMLDDVKIYTEPLADEKQLDYSIENKSGYDLTLNTDKQKLEHILLNLLSNAIKFTEKGEVKLSYDTEGSMLTIKVTDTGIGITDEEIATIFDDFKRGYSIAESKSGTGLGLSICKRYVDLLEGSLSVTSKVGKGTTFTLRLPDAVMSKTETEHQEEFEFVPEENKGHILLLSGSKASQKLIGEYLKQNKFSVSVNDTSEDEYDYIIADINNLYAVDYTCNLIGKKKILLTAFYEKEKAGYGFSLSGCVFENDIAALKKAVKDCSGGKDENICVLSNSPVNIDDIEGSKKVNRIYDYEYNESLALQDIIIIKIDPAKESCIHLFNELASRKSTREIPVIAILPQTSTILQDINKQAKEIAVAKELHPLDVLKVIRKQLKINYNTDIEEDETHTEAKKIETKSDYNVKPKVLVVDDDSDTLFTVGEIISNIGCDTYYAKNGVECLMQLNTLVPDLILLDIMMPVMDGFETIKRIRQDGRLRGVPVYALTAHSMLDNKDVVHKNGFNDLITKPIDTTGLSFKVERIINQHKVLN